MMIELFRRCINKFPYYDGFGLLINSIEPYKDQNNKERYKLVVIYSSWYGKKYNSSHKELDVSKETWVKEVFNEFPDHSYNYPRWGKNAVLYHVYDTEIGLNTDPISQLTERLEDTYRAQHNPKSSRSP
jgi:hypothetical protein